MYDMIQYILPIICIVGIVFMVWMKRRYQNDTSSTKEDILQYFKDHHITNLETGVRTKELPKEILKNPYLLMLVQDHFLIFKKGKYYLAENKTLEECNE